MEYACFDWIKNWGDFCINRKLYCDVICICTKVGNNPVVYKSKNDRFLCWVEMKIKWKEINLIFFGWSRFQPKKERKTFATVDVDLSPLWLIPRRKNIRFISYNMSYGATVGREQLIATLRKWAHKIGKLQEPPTRNIPCLNVQ